MAELEGQVNVVYEEMLSELITNLYKDRLKALAQGKVIATKYNEVLQLNTKLNEQLILTQTELSHKIKELEKLKKRQPKNAKSKDISK
jgi:poly-D-alanine transfer protein DltD|tara:strand:- start:746 stop:1009 length:264 start_codon:yes stop_codon:yes gene_type:complete